MDFDIFPKNKDLYDIAENLLSIVEYHNSMIAIHDNQKIDLPDKYFSQRETYRINFLLIAKQLNMKAQELVSNIYVRKFLRDKDNQMQEHPYFSLEGVLTRSSRGDIKSDSGFCKVEIKTNKGIEFYRMDEKDISEYV